MQRVLIVEDEASLRRLAALALKKSGSFTVVGEAADGVEGAEKAGTLQPDLILLDLLMPRMGGLEAMPLIRKASPKAAIVVYSMMRDPHYQERAFELGAIDYIDKGCTSNELIARLRALPQLAVNPKAKMGANRGQTPTT